MSKFGGRWVYGSWKIERILHKLPYNKYFIVIKSSYNFEYDYVYNSMIFLTLFGDGGIIERPLNALLSTLI